ncbi:hypothetical protein [Methylobacterium sp. JK268]
MAGAGALYDATKAAVLRDLQDMQRRHGAAYAGVACEAALAALVEFLRETQGPEASFNVLSRHADEASKPVLAARLDPNPQH